MTGTIRKRDRTFDIMKGIGILLVITAHIFNWNHPVLGRSINSFHMPMFFIVAGYFSKSYTSLGDAKTSVGKYARRLLPPVLFTHVTLILWALLMAIANKGTWDSVIRLTLSLFWADPHGPATPWGTLYFGVTWFLIALFIAKSLLLFLTRLKDWALPVSFIPAILAILLFKVLPISIWCISLGLTALPFVTIGWWVKTHPIPLSIKIVCVICWVLAILYSDLNMYGMIWKCFPLDVLGACGGTLCMYLFSKCLDRFINPAAKVFAVLGVWSLAIMCFHDIEISCHLGNHVSALFPFIVPDWGKHMLHYILPIAFAALAVRLPLIKRLFV